MGPATSKTKLRTDPDYQVQYVDESRHLTYLINRKTGGEYALKQLQNITASDYDYVNGLLTSKQSLVHEHIVALKEFTVQDEYAALLYQLPFRVLQQQKKERTSQGVVFQEHQLWSILASLILGFAYLQKRGIRHGGVRATNIYVEQSGIIKIADPWLKGEATNYQLLLNNDEQAPWNHKQLSGDGLRIVYVSPKQAVAIGQGLASTQHNAFKSDVFSLGVVVLDLALLRTLDSLYTRGANNRVNGINQQQLKESLSQFSRKYSDKLTAVMGMMLQMNQSARLDWNQLESFVRKEQQEEEKQARVAVVPGPNLLEVPRAAPSPPFLPQPPIYQHNHNVNAHMVPIQQQLRVNTVPNVVRQPQPNMPQSLTNRRHQLQPNRNIAPQTNRVSPHNYNSASGLVYRNTRIDVQPQVVTQGQPRTIHLNPHVSRPQQIFSVPKNIKNSPPRPVFIQQQQIHTPRPVSPRPLHLSPPRKPIAPQTVGASLPPYHQSRTHILSPPKNAIPRQQHNQQFNQPINLKSRMQQQQQPHQQQQQLRQTMTATPIQIPSLNKQVYSSGPTVETRPAQAFSFTNRRPLTPSPPFNMESTFGSPNNFQINANSQTIYFAKTIQPVPFTQLPNPAKQTENFVNRQQQQYFMPNLPAQSPIYNTSQNSQPKHSPPTQISIQGKIAQKTLQKKTSNSSNNYIQHGLVQAAEESSKDNQSIVVQTILKDTPNLQKQAEVVQSQICEKQNDSPAVEEQRKTIIDAVSSSFSRQETIQLAKPTKQNSELIAETSTERRTYPTAASVTENYQGQTLRSFRHGQGKYLFSDGGWYEGTWSFNRMHGEGKLYYADGRLAYEGMWKQDHIHGQGTLFNQFVKPVSTPIDYHDLSKLGSTWVSYTGSFQMDAKQGQGEILFVDGTRFKGMFKNNIIDGPGTVTTTKGISIQAVWKNGKIPNA